MGLIDWGFVPGFFVRPMIFFLFVDPLLPSSSSSPSLFFRPVRFFLLSTDAFPPTSPNTMASTSGTTAPSPTRKYKVVLLGEGRVGKTSLVVRYCQNTFRDDQQATIQASFLTKKLNVDGVKLELAIWDTAGQERFHALGPIYYRDADAALLVYDLTDLDSFERVKVRFLLFLFLPLSFPAICAT